MPSTRFAIRCQPSDRLPAREDPGLELPLPESRDQLFQGLRTPGDELARRPAVRRDASVQEGLLACARLRNLHQEHRRILVSGPSPLDILHTHDEEDALLEILLEFLQQKDRHTRLQQSRRQSISLRRANRVPPVTSIRMEFATDAVPGIPEPLIPFESLTVFRS